MKKYESPAIEQAGGNGEMGVPFHENHVAHQFDLAVTAHIAVIFEAAAIVAALAVAVLMSPPPAMSGNNRII